ncbi:MAG: VanY protein [Candidatus Magasanikbacteria bacterium]|nr:VanY protein [Candidatus Magasanikbacteria bacterium]
MMKRKIVIGLTVAFSVFFLLASTAPARAEQCSCFFSADTSNLTGAQNGVLCFKTGGSFKQEFLECTYQFKPESCTLGTVRTMIAGQLFADGWAKTSADAAAKSEQVVLNCPSETQQTTTGLSDILGAGGSCSCSLSGTMSGTLLDKYGGEGYCKSLKATYDSQNKTCKIGNLSYTGANDADTCKNDKISTLIKDTVKKNQGTNDGLALDVSNCKFVATTASTEPPPVLPFPAPKLEIPIPDLHFEAQVAPQDFTDASGKTYKVYPIPFIGQYVSGFIKYGLGFAGLLAALMIIISGLQWATAAGGSEAINSAKKRIANAVLGLLLLFGFYTVLYVINPDLVNFKPIGVRVAAQETLPPVELDDLVHPEEDAQQPTASVPKAPAGTLPCDTAGTTDSNFVNIAKANFAGVKAVVAVGRQPFVSPATAEALKKAGQIADSKGYYIHIHDACRSLERQTANAEKCQECVNAGTVAKIGKSPHGYGVAMDVELHDKATNKTVMPITGSDKQCSAPPEGVKILSEIMYAAGFYRLGIENWHFEFPKYKDFCRKRTFTGVAGCRIGSKQPACPAGE